jgi:hypothetical protein
MDPIHPIVPLAPGITPITPAPMAGRVDREGGRNPGQERDKRHDRPQDPEAEGDDIPSAGDDGLTHIDVTA